MSASEEVSVGAQYDLRMLRLESLQNICKALYVLAGAWSTYLAFRVPHDDLFTWLFPALLALGAIVAQWLAQKHPPLAGFALCLTLVGLAGLYGWFRAGPAGPFLTIPAILAASVILPPLWTFFITLTSLIMTGTIAWLGGNAGFASTLYLGWLFSAVTWVLSYVATHNLQLAVRWANLSQKAALESLEGLRERRAELRRLSDLLRQNQERLHYLNIRLEQAKVAAEEAYRMKQHFVANVSHELRTPLNLITGFSELMAFSPSSYGGIQLPPAYRQDVMEIWRSSKHLLGLVEDVLALAQLEAGHMIVKRDWGDLTSVVRDACETIAPLIEAKGLDLEIDLPSSLPPVYMDAGRIRQVLLNLLNNAQRFTHEGKVSVCVQPGAQEVVVSVSDTGVGIAPEDLPHIFEEFHNLSKGPTSGSSGGFGLGLSISRRLMEAHGGRLWAESTPGQGSTFFLSLPLNAQEGITSRPTLIRTASRPGIPRRKPVLLVISDDEDDILKHHLGDFEVVYAPLREARNAFEQYLPVAIWVNRQPTHEGLPAELDGLASSTPIITCRLPTRADFARQMRADYFLRKPVTREQLLQAIAALEAENLSPIRTVLIIDDDPPFLRMMQRFLAGNTLRVLTTSDAEEGLEILEHEKPDVLLLDLAMPNLNGYDVLAALAQREDGRGHTRIVLVSGVVRDEREALVYALHLESGLGVPPLAAVRAAKAFLDSSGLNRQEGGERLEKA